MGKRQKRWPIWAIGLAAVGWAVGGGVLIWLGTLADSSLVRAEGAPAGEGPGSALPTIIMGIGVACFVLCVIMFIWMGYRIQQARIPPWERGKKKRR